MSSVPKCTQTGPLGNSNKFYNSLGQSPCYIASALANVCMGGGYTLPSLNASQPEYSGPSAANANSCMCSTVYYSLLSACSICQTFGYSGWSSYARNCQTVYISTFPQPIPAGTSVPHYAYLDVRASDTFNPAVVLSVGARQALVAPPGGTLQTAAGGEGAVTMLNGVAASALSENPVATTISNTGNLTTSTTSAIASSSSTISRSSSTQSSPTSSRIGSSIGSATQPTVTPTHSSSSTKGGSTNIIGPILAGVGFLLLVLIVGLIWFCKIEPRRRRARIPTRNVPKLERSLSQYSLLNPPASTGNDSGGHLLDMTEKYVAV